MDEYLFIAMAKLKADRWKLEREQRGTAAIAEPPLEAPVEPAHSTATHSARQAPKSRWFSRQPLWREQS